jgi:hypothetical protein
MFDFGAAALFLLTMMTVVPDEGAAAAEEMQLAQVIIREQIIIRVRSGERPMPQQQAAATEWRERKGPKCVAASTIAGATGLSRTSVDLVLRDQSRIRARLNSNCPALDYYYGFYVDPTPDGQICADRDIIRSRVGGQCGIETFRALQPVARP